MVFDKNKGFTLFALTLLIMSLLFVNVNVSVKAQVEPSPSKYLHEVGGLTTLHLDAKAGLISLTNPLQTYWHELYPVFCRGDYRLDSWNDTDHDEMLDWCDQIDIFYLPQETKSYYHVERVMATLNLTRQKDEYRIYVEYNGTLPFYDPINSPVCTLWHEVYPVWCTMYHIVGVWYDNPPTGLSYCDLIDMENLTSHIIERWHVEKVSTDMIVTQKNTAPLRPAWHELYPTYSNRYNLTDWIDNNGDGELSPRDNINLTNMAQQWAWYQVDDVTITLNMTLIDTTYWIMVEFTGPCLYDHYWDPPIIHPIGTTWHEVYPVFCTKFILNSWIDNGDSILSKCDRIDTINETDGSTQYWHVTEVAKDIIVTEIVPPPPPPTLYWKLGYPNYAPSGMPDFNQKQDNWVDPQQGRWSWCAPTAVANSLWWMDSRFHPSNLLTAYAGAISEHDPSNVIPFITHLAYLMDTNGMRIIPGGGAAHYGTWTRDMETGIAQYLAWTGVNAKGDVNGDGIVNLIDVNIVTAANGTTPASPGWNMALDIWPVTTGWPNINNADNIVNNNDINLVLANFGNRSTFSEVTAYAPFFNAVETEVERCEDVILLLGFYDNSTGTWVRCPYDYPPAYPVGSGHAVTVAGVNSTALKIAVSDPCLDAFHDNLITEGRVPVAHPPYPHNSSIHNNASLVSQDIYNVTLLGAGAPGQWALQGYAGAPGVYTIAVVEAVVITSPIGVNDVAITDVKPAKTIVSNETTVSIYVNATNQGNYTETFNVTAYANSTAIGTQTVISLPPGNTTTLTFIWNTTGWAKGNYTISAVADTVSGEADTADNTRIDGTVKVTIAGDVNGDGIVDIFDIVAVGIAFGAVHIPSCTYWHVPPCPNCPHDPNTDLNDDGIIDIFDIVTIGIHFGQTDP